MLFAGSVVSFAVTVVSVACKTVPSVVHLGCTAIDCGRLITRTLWVKHASCLPRSISTTTFLLGHQPQRYHDCSTKDQLSPTPPTATADNRKSGVLASFRSRSREKYNDKTADEVELYFAYGANMSPTVLTGKRGVEPLASLPAEVVAFATAAPDYERGAGILGPLDRGIAGGGGGGGGGIYTCFCHRAGFATIMPSPGPPQAWDLSPGAHGVVHVLSRSDVDTIASSETGYKRCLVEVETSEGEKDRAVCFVSDPMQTLQTSVPPTSRYLALLRDGASFHGIDKRYQSWLATLPSVPSKDAEAFPERTNTPMKALIDRILLVTTTAAVAAAIVSSGFVLG